MNLKIKRGILLHSSNLHIKFQGHTPKRSLSIGQIAFCDEGTCDLDIWHIDLKINRGILLLSTNLL